MVRKWTGTLVAIAMVVALLVPAAVAWADEQEQTGDNSAVAQTQAEQEPAGEGDDGTDEDAGEEAIADESEESAADEDGDGSAAPEVDPAWVAELEARLADVRTRIAALEAAAETAEETESTGETAADDDTAAVTEPESAQPAEQDVTAETSDGRGKGQGKGQGKGKESAGGRKAAAGKDRSAATGTASTAGSDDTGSEGRGHGHARRAEASAKAQETLAAVAAKQVAKGNLNAAGAIITSLTRLNPEAPALVSLQSRLLLANHDLDGAEAVLVEALGELEGLRALEALLVDALNALGVDPDAAPGETPDADDTTADDAAADTEE